METGRSLDSSFGTIAEVYSYVSEGLAHRSWLILRGSLSFSLHLFQSFTASLIVLCLDILNHYSHGIKSARQSAKGERVMSALKDADGPYERTSTTEAARV